MTGPRAPDLAPELAALDDRFDIATREVTVAGQVWRLEQPRSFDDLISEADYVKDERLPYWADLWGASVVLAAEVCTLDGSGQTAIELGCGLGVPSIAAAYAGFAVTATDYYDDAPLFARRNALHNVGRDIAAQHLDWTAIPDDHPRFDLVLAADVLYEPRYSALVSNAVLRSLSPTGMALVADQGRIALEGFREACTAHGATITPRRVMVHEDAPAKLTITIYEVRLG